MVIRIAAPLLMLVLAASISWTAQAQTAPTLLPPMEPSLFAVEIKVGPNWDATKPPQEQAYFQEHSTNLRRMREDGNLILGARYSDKGLVVVAASSAEDVRSMMGADPSIAAGTFVFEVHPFNVFYPGTLQASSHR